jgi:hypothetical protein
VEYEAWRAEALNTTAATLARIDDPIAGLESAATIDDPVWRAEAILSIAAELVRQRIHPLADSTIADATRIAESIGYQWWQHRASTVAALAAAFASVGDVAAGLRLAELTPHPVVRSQVVLGITEGLTELAGRAAIRDKDVRAAIRVLDSAAGVVSTAAAAIALAAACRSAWPHAFGWLARAASPPPRAQL